MRAGFGLELKAWRGQIAPIAAISLFGFSMSMSYPLISLLLERMGASPTVIGLNAAGYALAMVVGAPFLPFLLKRIGLITLLLGSCITMAITMVAFPLFPGVLSWALLRIASGFAGTALFFASEYWVVGAASDQARGRIVSIYAIAVSISFMMGPLAIGVTGTDTAAPFALAAGVILLGLVPIVWGRRSVPATEASTQPSIQKTFSFFVSDPTVIWGVVLFGATEFGTLALLPIWALHVGMGEKGAVVLLAVFASGAVLLQWPVGWAADRYGRRGLFALAGLVCVLSPLAVIRSANQENSLYAFVFLWGAAAVALYTLALVELGARYSGTRLSEANASVITAYGIGALVAPALLGWAMDLGQPHGLLWATSLLSAFYLVLTLLRRNRNPANPS